MSIINQNHNLKVAFFLLCSLLAFNLFYTNQNSKICIFCFLCLCFAGKRSGKNQISARKGIFENFTMEIDLPMREIDFPEAKLKKNKEGSMTSFWHLFSLI